jgi:hypothetical protein
MSEQSKEQHEQHDKDINEVNERMTDIEARLSHLEKQWKLLKREK